MMTSLLAEESVIVKNKKLMNFMNEIMNPPCNSLLATFFELDLDVCPKKASFCLRKFFHPDRTISQLFKLFPLPLFNVPDEKVAGERGEERPVGSPQRPIEVSGACETERGTGADEEDEDEDVDVVGGVDEVWVSGYQLRGSRSQKSFVERDWRRRMCPRVLLTPLTFHNVSFQIFINYQ